VALTCNTWHVEATPCGETTPTVSIASSSFCSYSPLPPPCSLTLQPSPHPRLGCPFVAHCLSLLTHLLAIYCPLTPAHSPSLPNHHATPLCPPPCQMPTSSTGWDRPAHGGYRHACGHGGMGWYPCVRPCHAASLWCRWYRAICMYM